MDNEGIAVIGVAAVVGGDEVGAEAAAAEEEDEGVGGAEAGKTTVGGTRPGRHGNRDDFRVSIECTYEVEGWRDGFGMVEG
mmetsp:Transcript_24803/g.57802  ORF Transcript_24803/g.57802 Transcript_24803/m.57802 type:complete len:81 (-) Transcript_24803:1408-1650(-)